MKLEEIIDLNKYQLSDDSFKESNRSQFKRDGVLILPDFLSKKAIESVQAEGVQNQDKAYYCTDQHNSYQMPFDPEYAADHPRNKLVDSSKGCLADDQIPENSALKTLYESKDFKDFLSYVLEEEGLFPYADEVSPINLHFAQTGQELGWHYDHSSFSITLMIQPAEKGGEFEYVQNLRDADNGDMNFVGTDEVVTGKTTADKISLPAGALSMFRGRNAIHRVTPNLGEATRMLVVFAYNSKSGIAIAPTARKVFYGR